MAQTGHDEQEPLLQDPSSSQGPALSRVKSTQGSEKWLGFHTISRRYRWVPLLGCLIVLVNELEYYIKQVATLRALEAMHCYEFYLARGSPLADLGKKIPEKLCKDDSIQKNLATSAGLIMFVRMLSALIGAFPLGWVSDRFGRKPVLVLHKVNMAFACLAWALIYVGYPRVPLWALYFSGIPGLFGGNFDVSLAMFFASYIDVMPSATERASLFFLTTSMQYLAEITGPAVGARLMDLDGKGGTPEVNLFTSLAIAVLTVAMTVFLFPETVHESRQAEVKSATDGEASSITSASSRANERKLGTWYKKLQDRFRDAVSGVGTLNMMLLCLTITFTAIGIKAIDWYAILQYPVIRLHWTFPQASNIVVMAGFLMLLHFSIILPGLTRVAAARLGPTRAHFAIMIGSVTLLTTGALAMGFSGTSAVFVASVVLYLLGEGLPTAAQAYVASLIEKSKSARAMAFLSMFSILGKLGASILFPKLLGWGLDLHRDDLVGLPFFACAIMFVFSAVCVSIVDYRISSARKSAAEGP